MSMADSSTIDLTGLQTSSQAHQGNLSDVRRAVRLNRCTTAATALGKHLTPPALYYSFAQSLTSDSDRHNPIEEGEIGDRYRAALLAEYLTAIEPVCPEPLLMPLKESKKESAIVGNCDLDSDEAKSMLHTPTEAVKAVRNGHRGFCLYAGKELHGTDELCFVDHDDIEEFPLTDVPETLTVKTGNGWHTTFVNDGSVDNSRLSATDPKTATVTDGAAVGEVRSHNWYVCLPGTTHKNGSVYHTYRKDNVATLSLTDVPERLRSSKGETSELDEEYEANVSPPQTSFINDKGYSLEECRKKDGKLDSLLTTPVGSGDASVVDGNLVAKLRYHHFSHQQIEAIWRQHRPRNKLERTDYVQRTLRNRGTHNDRWDYNETQYITHLPNTSVGEYSGDTEFLSEVRERLQSVLRRLYNEGGHTLIEALPSSGKSYGAVKAAKDTNTSVALLTSRTDLYQQYSDWCDELGLTHYELPSFHNDCPTANGEYANTLQTKVRRLYNQGLTGKEIHQRSEELFGQRLPCQSNSQCPYVDRTNFDEEGYDALIGNYVHANSDAIDNRVVVFDEFTEEAFITEVDGSKVSAIASKYLQNNQLPFADYTELLEGRSSVDLSEHIKVSMWGNGIAPDVASVEASDSDTHVLAPLVVGAIYQCNDLGNGYEETTVTVDTDFYEAEYNVVRNRSNGTLYFLQRPELDDADGVVCLDGTPTLPLWQKTVDPELSLLELLSESEKRRYLSDVLGMKIVQTSTDVKPYSSGNYVTPEKDASLINSICNKYDKPSLISTKGALDQYSDEGCLDGVSEVLNYGGLKGSNELAAESVGIVAGSPHYGDSYVKQWGGFFGESIEGDSSNAHKGRQYNGIGSDVAKHMTEHQVLQAVLRFGRDSSVTESTVFVHTDCLPNWVPVYDTGSINKVSDGLRSVTSVLRQSSDLTKKEITNDISLSESQVKRHLYDLRDLGYTVETTNPGKATIYNLSEVGREVL